jgi:hypothetical protein
MSVSWHIKFAAVARLGEQQFVRASEKWVKFLILRDENLRLILSVKEGQHFDDEKGVLKLCLLTCKVRNFRASKALV